MNPPYSLRVFLHHVGEGLVRTDRNTWFLWLFALWSGFISSREAGGFRLSVRGEWVEVFAFGYFVALWVIRDARQRKGSMGFGFPALVFFLWPLFGPLYLFQTRGVRAFWSILAFVSAFTATTAVGFFLGQAIL